MTTFRYGGAAGVEYQLEDDEEFVVVRTRRRGELGDEAITPLSSRARATVSRSTPVLSFREAGVEVLRVAADDRADALVRIEQEDAIQFAGRGLRDPVSREPVVYTENLFVKFAEGTPEEIARGVLAEYELEVKRVLGYASSAYFVGAPEGVGRRVFDTAAELLGRDGIELCHPELVREVAYKAAFAQQWHLQPATIGGQAVDAHAGVVAAWELSTGSGVTVAIIDDGVALSHEEFQPPDKVVSPRDVTLRVDTASPGGLDNHGTACSGVACAAGKHGAAGVAPDARLMPIRFVSGLGSQGEADAFVWAADHGADVISCSWGPLDGAWWDDGDPQHGAVVPLPDSTRLAIDYAITTGRGGKGCVITWAAGNGNEPVDNDGYASYEKVIAVAASNDRSRRSRYSDKGRALWCAFPSNDVADAQPLTTGIWTTDRPGGAGYNPGRPELGDSAGNYTNSFGGTSSACPGVAGVAALMLARNPNLTWEQVRAYIRDACDQIGDEPDEYDANGHSENFGYGRVNARRSGRARRLARSPSIAAPRPARASAG